MVLTLGCRAGTPAGGAAELSIDAADASRSSQARASVSERREDVGGAEVGDAAWADVDCQLVMPPTTDVDVTTDEDYSSLGESLRQDTRYRLQVHVSVVASDLRSRERTENFRDELRAWLTANGVDEARVTVWAVDGPPGGQVVFWRVDGPCEGRVAAPEGGARLK